MVMKNHCWWHRAVDDDDGALRHDATRSQLLSQCAQIQITFEHNGACVGTACLGFCPAFGITLALCKPYTSGRWFGQETIDANVVGTLVVCAVVDDHRLLLELCLLLLQETAIDVVGIQRKTAVPLDCVGGEMGSLEVLVCRDLQERSPFYIGLP